MVRACAYIYIYISKQVSIYICKYAHLRACLRSYKISFGINDCWKLSKNLNSTLMTLAILLSLSLLNQHFLQNLRIRGAYTGIYVAVCASDVGRTRTSVCIIGKGDTCSCIATGAESVKERNKLSIKNANKSMHNVIQKIFKISPSCTYGLGIQMVVSISQLVPA